MTETKLPEWLKKEKMTRSDRRGGDSDREIYFDGECDGFNAGLVRAWELTQERITEIKAMIISYLKDGEMENDEKEYAILKHIDEVFK